MAISAAERQRRYAKRHPNRVKARIQKWRAANREHLLQYSRDRYEKRRNTILKQQRRFRSKPRVKKQRAEYNRKYRAEHWDAVRSHRRAYYTKNRVSILARQKQYRCQNQKKILKRVAAWQKQNKERRKLHCHRYRATHPLNARQYYERNRDRLLKQSKERGRKWRKQFPHKQRESAMRHYARKLAALIGDPREIRTFYRHVVTARRVNCHWCGKNIPKALRTVDHVIPLVRHGPHAIHNLVPACKPCNCSKGSRLPEEWKRLANRPARLFAV
jgi:hypothetical protein